MPRTLDIIEWMRGVIIDGVHAPGIQSKTVPVYTCMDTEQGSG